MKNKTKVEELDAALVLMQKRSASDGVGDHHLELNNTRVKCFNFMICAPGECSRQWHLITSNASGKESKGKITNIFIQL